MKIESQSEPLTLEALRRQLAEAQHELKSVYESLRNRTRELAETQAREAAWRLAAQIIVDRDDVYSCGIALTELEDLLATPAALPNDLVALVKALRTLWKRADAEGQDCDFAMEALASPLATAALRQLEEA